MQHGAIGLRSAITALWQEDLRAVREDRYDTDRGKEGLAFIRRFNAAVGDLRVPIQQAWGAGALVHVADNSEVAGPGQRVSQTRIKLRNHGDVVVAEAFSYSDGSPSANPALGLDREIPVAEIDPMAFVHELYRTLVAFLQTALSVDLALSGPSWLYEQMVADYFTANASWPALGELYQRVTREFAVEESFETVTGMFKAEGLTNGDLAVSLGIDRLHRCCSTQTDMDNFVRAIGLAVEADQAMCRINREDAARELNLDDLGAIKLGRLLSLAPDICRDREASEDLASWSFLPSYNVHFFRRVKSIDDYLATCATVNLSNGAVAGSPVTQPERDSQDEPAGLPDGVVTFLMTDVVESTQLWLQSRAQMYGAMRRHDQLLTMAIEANNGIVLKERGEGDSFFAVFNRPTDALAAALAAQVAIMSERWADRIPINVRMAILTGEADAQDRDYRSPAVNRCAKLRRRAVGNQILVSETTYSIVADILRDDMHLVGVGKRRLEGHDRPEEVYVLQHADVALDDLVQEDDLPA
ncbi:MAG TPA: adenylate/guanylate cyclase domain-containing protein [Candidatus Dormibacteraeota bacterium]|nr:adenylate/guanylate cyclase domain-containing protein [Candidatus Dormibacteraeota bacterium]